MRKITLLLLLFMVSSFVFAIDVTNSAEFAAALTSAASGETINLAAGTYYPPEVTLTFSDYWANKLGTTTIEKTFNAFVVPGKDIVINGTDGVIFDRTVGGNEWQMAFLFFSDGDATDGTGVTFQNFTVEDLDYGMVNSWAFTRNEYTSTTSSRMEYTIFNNLDFVRITQSGIILEPFFINSYGTKGSNNTDLFSSTHYNWRSITGSSTHDFSYGKVETTSRCIISNCNFNVGAAVGSSYFNKAMVNVVAVVCNVSDCVFEKGWRGFHMYAGPSTANFTTTPGVAYFTNNTFNDIDFAAYPGITVNPYENPNYEEDPAYIVGRACGLYRQSGKLGVEFSGNYYQVRNGATAVYTDGLVSESNDNETYNYTGSVGWAKDLHNVSSQITLDDCNFYIYDDGLGIVITKHGDCLDDGLPTLNPAGSEYYTYKNSYGTLNQPVLVRNCNFYGINVNHDYPGAGSGIFLADWEHYYRDAFGISVTNRNGESAIYVEGCVFQDLYAGLFVDAGRPDQLRGSDNKVSRHDDGRLQVYVTDSKFLNCEYSADFSYWDQWVRTNSFVILENNYFGADVDPYSTFNFATNFPVEDGYYDLTLSGIYGSDGDDTDREYPGETTELDNYHVFTPQYLQYLPYYTDEDMTQLCGLEVDNLVVTRSGSDYILDWTDNANAAAKYAIYAADSPYPVSWGTALETVETSTYTYAAGAATEKYFKVAVIIPNISKGNFYGTNYYNTANFGNSLVFTESANYAWPAGFTYPVDYYYGATPAIQTTGLCGIDFEYADDAAYAVAKAGFMKKTLTTTTGTDYNFISLPFTGQYSTVAQLAAYLGLNTSDAISAWNETTQAWQSAGYYTSWDEAFVPVINQPYMITASSTHDIYLMGKIPTPPVYNMMTTNTTDLNFIMIPLNCTLANASALGTQVGNNNAVTISRWVEADQSWSSCVYLNIFNAWIGDNFTITPGMPIVIGAEQNFTWPQ